MSAPGRPPRRALVVGGGYAGASAALALASHGVEVTLLEARPAWGGRATSWPDPRMHDVVDNGQHVWMGCYADAFALLDTLGTRHLVPLAPRLALAFREPGGRAHRLAAPALPGRLGLAAALARYGALPVAARLRLARALRSAPPPYEVETAEDWLDRIGQGADERRAFWSPMVEAAVNLPLREAAGELLFAVVREAFRGPAHAATVAVPRAGLADLLAPVPDRLAARGGRARVGAVARCASAGSVGGWALGLESGETLEADALVLAVPAADARALVAADLPDVAARLDAAAAVASSPIVTATLWYDAPVAPAPMTGLLAARSGAAPDFQWVFDRAHHVASVSGTWPLTLVASAARDLLPLASAAILERAAATLADYGVTRRAALAGRVVKEPHATPALGPVAARARVGPASGRAGLAFAGDWTATGLPATIEGAVRSGRAAARHLLGSAMLGDHARSAGEGSTA